MLHHGEYPEKPQYNMATRPFLEKPSPILPYPPFSSKNFHTPHLPTPTPAISINYEKVKPLPFMKDGGGGGGGIQTM